MAGTGPKVAMGISDVERRLCRQHDDRTVGTSIDEVQRPYWPECA